MDREQCFKQLRESLDFLEKSSEIVHLPDNIGQDIEESKLADLMRYLVDIML